MTCTPSPAVRRHTRAARWLAAASVALLAACATPTTRFYTLAEPPPKATPNRPTAPDAAPLVIEMAPLGLPERLARPQMLVREARAPSAQVRLLEQHQWSSSFESELRDALANGVATRLGAVYSTQRLRPAAGRAAWRVAVQVSQFDLVEGDQAEAALSWTLQPPDATTGLSCQWSGHEPAGPGIDALAQAAQRLTARAADAMARHLAAARAGAAAACSGASSAGSQG